MISRKLPQISKFLGTSSASISTLQKIDPTQEALLEEKCILVDENDNPVGTESKRNCHLLSPDGSSKLHRAFSLFIFNSQNQLLLQQRSDVKVTFPGLWTNSCCSHPLSFVEEMESKDAIGVRRAAVRRIQNELGINPEEVPADQVKYLTRILYSAPSQCGIWGENELDYILFLRSDVKINPNPNEVQNVALVSRSEIKDFVECAKSEGVGITPWFSLIVDSFLPKWWDNLDKIEQFVDHQNIRRFS